MDSPPRDDRQSSGEAILSSGLDGTIETCNPAAALLYGYSATEMVGTAMEVLHPPETDDVSRAGKR